MSFRTLRNVKTSAALKINCREGSRKGCMQIHGVGDANEEGCYDVCGEVFPASPGAKGDYHKDNKNFSQLESWFIFSISTTLH